MSLIMAYGNRKRSEDIRHFISLETRKILRTVRKKNRLHELSLFSTESAYTRKLTLAYTRTQNQPTNTHAFHLHGPIPMYIDIYYGEYNIMIFCTESEIVEPSSNCNRYCLINCRLLFLALSSSQSTIRIFWIKTLKVLCGNLPVHSATLLNYHFFFHFFFTARIKSCVGNLLVHFWAEQPKSHTSTSKAKFTVIYVIFILSNDHVFNPVWLIYDIYHCPLPAFPSYSCKRISLRFSEGWSNLLSRLKSRSHRRDVASPSLFYKYFHCNCSNNLLSLVPRLH